MVTHIDLWSHTRLTCIAWKRGQFNKRTAIILEYNLENVSRNLLTCYFALENLQILSFYTSQHVDQSERDISLNFKFSDRYRNKDKEWQIGNLKYFKEFTVQYEGRMAWGGFSLIVELWVEGQSYTKKTKNCAQKIHLTSIDSLLKTISFISITSSSLEISEPFLICFLTSTPKYSSWKYKCI